MFHTLPSTSHALTSLLLVCILSVAIAACDSSDPDPPPGSPTGTLEITAATTGDTPDPNGYTVTLDGDESREVGPDGTVTFEDVEEGDHEVEISGVQVNCAPDGGAMQTVTVTAEETTSTTFNVACEAALFDQIVFTSTQDGDQDIFVMGTDGSNPTLLGGTAENDEDPDVSHNGERIAFTSDPTGPNSDLYIMDADGTGVSRLTNDPADDESPTWSPDGERIAFASDRDSGDPDIYVMKADGTGVTRLTNDPGDDFWPTWSPDGERIAFTSDRDGDDDIYVVNADGTDVTRLTDYSGFDGDPSWSPDGERIAFLSDRGRTSSYRSGGGWDTYVMNADGSDVTRLTNNTDSDSDYAPAWSPDGERVAFRREWYDGDDWANDIFVINADGSGSPVNLTENNGAFNENPTWAPARTEQ